MKRRAVLRHARQGLTRATKSSTRAAKTRWTVRPDRKHAIHRVGPSKGTGYQDAAPTTRHKDEEGTDFTLPCALLKSAQSLVFSVQKAHKYTSQGLVSIATA